MTSRSPTSPHLAAGNPDVMLLNPHQGMCRSSGLEPEIRRCLAPEGGRRHERCADLPGQSAAPRLQVEAKANLQHPTTTTSPSARGTGAQMRRPLILVPCEDPRSVTQATPFRSVMRQWRRETSGSGRHKWQEVPRPITTSPTSTVAIALAAEPRQSSRGAQAPALPPSHSSAMRSATNLSRS